MNVKDKECSRKYCKRREVNSSGMCILCLFYWNHWKSWDYVPFTSQVILIEGHWAWDGAGTDSGYGLFLTREGRVVMAHRASYEHYKKRIPKGKVLDHLCREPICVNPNHLEPVTPQVNHDRRNTPPMKRKYGRKEIEL